MWERLEKVENHSQQEQRLEQGKNEEQGLSSTQSGGRKPHLYSFFIKGFVLFNSFTKPLQSVMHLMLFKDRPLHPDTFLLVQNLFPFERAFKSEIISRFFNRSLLWWLFGNIYKPFYCISETFFIFIPHWKPRSVHFHIDGNVNQDTRKHLHPPCTTLID